MRRSVSLLSLIHILADLLTDQIYDAMTDVPEVTNVEVKLVWYPAWTVEKMSRYARIALGIK